MDGKVKIEPEPLLGGLGGEPMDLVNRSWELDGSSVMKLGRVAGGTCLHGGLSLGGDVGGSRWDPHVQLDASL